MIKVNGIPVGFIKFPGGELHVKLDCGSLRYSIGSVNRIHAMIENSDDVMLLLMTTDAIRQEIPRCPIELYMPYIPYARQDRVANPGEALSIKVFADLINSQNYDVVYVDDPHSYVSSALIDRCHITDSSFYVGKVLNPKLSGLCSENVVLISPDAGAMKKVQAIGETYNIPVVCATKSRDTKTGKLSNTKIDFGDVDVTGKDLLIVDDIIDGGGTFILLADAIKKTVDIEMNTLKPVYNSLNLYVTHGIFSKGIDVITEKFDKVFVVNPFSGVDLQTSRLVIIN